MIKFFYHQYSLTPQTKISAVADELPRSGALLKIQWPDSKIGFSDLFPWPELGDEKLNFHLAELKNGHITSLVEQSIWLARKDAKLRSENKNAFQAGQKVKNHYLINDFTTINDSTLNQVKTAGFTTIKVKVGRDWKAEIEWINKVLRQYGFNLRLDFNCKGDLATLERMIGFLSLGLRPKIEFAEDPFPWDLAQWLDAAKILPLAMDGEYAKLNWKELPKELPFKVLVLKPARQDVEEVIRNAKLRNLKVVVTSAMDHPVGVAHAIKVAADLKAENNTMMLESGCMTIKTYRHNEFSTQMTFQGPYLSQIRGTGIGFDKTFSEIPWTPIESFS